MFKKFKNFITKFYQKYLNPQNVYEENFIVFNLMVYFTVFPINLKNIKNNKFNLKYLIFPAICITFCIFMTIYILTSNFIKKHFGILKHVQMVTLLLYLFSAIFSIISIYFLQYFENRSILCILQKIYKYDEFFKGECDLKHSIRLFFTIVGLIIFISQWSFFFINALNRWTFDIIFYELIYFFTCAPLTLILFLYTSVIHSITQKFFYISKLIESNRKKNLNILEFKIVLHNLVDLCEILSEINNSFGKLIFIVISLVFISTTTDFFGILFGTLNNGVEESITSNIAYIFTTADILNIFIMIYVCDKCGQQVC